MLNLLLSASLQQCRTVMAHIHVFGDQLLLLPATHSATSARMVDVIADNGRIKYS